MTGICQTALIALLAASSLVIFPDVMAMPWRLAILLAVLAGSLLLHASGLLTPFRLQFYALLIVFLLVLARAGEQAADQLACVLPESLAGKTLLVEGEITGLPQQKPYFTRFEFSVGRYLDKPDSPGSCLPEYVRLHWYQAPELSPGDRWQLQVRLKPPRGFVNQYGFDYERWLFSKGIQATGYVRAGGDNERQAESDWRIDRWRQHINSHIQASIAEPASSGMLQALATGNRQQIPPRDWQTLIRTGTNHLVAISGLHIGLAAALGWWLSLLVARYALPIRVMLFLPAQHIAALGSLSVAGFYALLAGMGIPTQRALLMLACFVIASLSRRHSSPWQALAIALLLVLMLMPASVHAPGFWFSFSAVFSIILASQLGLKQRPRWQQLVLLQLMLSLLALPLSLGFFQQGSMLAPVANLVMVPVVSLLIVPLLLLAMLLIPVSTVLSQSLLHLDAVMLQWLMQLMTWLAASPLAVLQQHLSTSQMLVLLAALVMLVKPLPWMYRLLIAILLLVLAYAHQQQRLQHGEFVLTVLDVGQGNAVVVRTRHSALVYDSGDRLGDSNDAGRSVVMPYLLGKDVEKIDTLVISHGDRDHIGGASSLLSRFSTGQLYGQGIGLLRHEHKSACHQGQRWQADGVSFEFLHPPIQPRTMAGNNASCVLRIQGAGGSALLTGDIEAAAEARLLAAYPDGQLKADILLVPHHGSKTSSSKAFLHQVSADYAIIPAGYRSRYRHPAASVVTRYQQQGSRVLVSGLQGAIEFRVSPQQGVSAPRLERLWNRRFWRASAVYPQG